MKKIILVCEYNIAKLEEKEIHVFVLNHFYCHCYFGYESNFDLHGKYLVAICDKHPLFSDYVIEEKLCTCYKLGPFEICSYCINNRYVLIFNAKKVCIQEVPEYFENIKTLDEYLKSNLNVNVFFTFQSLKM